MSEDIMKTDDLLTVAEVAQKLRLAKQTIYRKVYADAIPYLKTGRGKKFAIRFDKKAINDWMQTNTQATP